MEQMRNLNTTVKDLETYGFFYGGLYKKWLEKHEEPCGTDCACIRRTPGTDRWRLIVTDSERGLPSIKARNTSKEAILADACHFDMLYRYSAYHKALQEHLDAYDKELDEWLSGYAYTDKQKKRTLSYLKHQDRVLF